MKLIKLDDILDKIFNETKKSENIYIFVYILKDEYIEEN